MACAILRSCQSAMFMNGSWVYLVLLGYEYDTAASLGAFDDILQGYGSLLECLRSQNLKGEGILLHHWHVLLMTELLRLIIHRRGLRLTPFTVACGVRFLGWLMAMALESECFHSSDACGQTSHCFDWAKSDFLLSQAKTSAHYQFYDTCPSRSASWPFHRLGLCVRC